MPGPAVIREVLDGVHASDERGGQLPERREDEVVGAEGERAADLRRLLAFEPGIDGELALALQRDALAIQAPRQDHPSEQLVAGRRPEPRHRCRRPRSRPAPASGGAAPHLRCPVHRPPSRPPTAESIGDGRCGLDSSRHGSLGVPARLPAARRLPARRSRPIGSATCCTARARRRSGPGTGPRARDGLGHHHAGRRRARRQSGSSTDGRSSAPGGSACACWPACSRFASPSPWRTRGRPRVEGGRSQGGPRAVPDAAAEPRRDLVRAPEPVARADPLVRPLRRRRAAAARGRTRPAAPALPHHRPQGDAPRRGRGPGAPARGPRPDQRVHPGPAPVDGRLRPSVAPGAGLRVAQRL